MCNFFLNSPKRNELLIEIVTNNVDDVAKRSPLIDLCKTRWAVRHNAYSHFYCCYKFIIVALEVIGLGLHTETLSNNFCNAFWDSDSKNTATSLLHSLTDFSFIVVLMVYQFLSHLAGVTVKLQSRAIDIVDAYNSIDEILSLYKQMRSNVEGTFDTVYKHAERVAATVNVQPNQPRICRQQLHHPNAAASTIEEWYQINAAIPFLDHIISDLSCRFSPLAKRSSTLLCLVPSVLCTDKNVSFSEILDMYSGDLPSPELFDQEISHWKHKFVSASVMPDTCASALKQCDKIMFPNIHTLLKIACTIPVSSCECERGGSTLR